MNAPENVAWQGRPSQWVNLGWFLLCVFPLLIPVAFWKWLVVRCMSYELTTERLRLRHGVLNRKVEQIELYRVRDYAIEQPLWLRPVGLSHVVLNTADQTNPVIRLRAVPGGEVLMDRIREAVEACRTRKGVRDLEVN